MQGRHVATLSRCCRLLYSCLLCSWWLLLLLQEWQQLRHVHAPCRPPRHPTCRQAGRQAGQQHSTAHR